MRQRLGNGDVGDAKRGCQRGFTLIEALVVVVILGMLAAVIVFAVGGSTDKAQTSACATERRVVETAVESYRAVEGEYPTSTWQLTEEPNRFLREMPEYHTVSNDGQGTVLAAGKCADTPEP